MTKKHVIQTAAFSAAILAIVVALDFLVNVVLMPGLTPYTPVGTICITLLVAPAFVFILIRQNARVEQAHLALAEAHAARLAADSANEAKSRFLANMSHELRTPLDAIIGYAEIIEEESAESGQHNNADDSRRVQRAAHHLLGLINDILDHSKIEAGKMRFCPALTPLAPLLAEVADALRGEAAKNRCALVLDEPPDPGMALLDSMRFKQCLINLTANAVKFTRDGQVILRLRDTAFEGVAAIRIDVIDTGIGISDDAMARLFTPFTQANNSVTRQFGGTGLGLAITRSLIEAMGGRISAESKLGAGSRFSLIIPRCVRDTPVRADPQAAAA